MFKNRQPRGPKRYTWTMDDLAAIVGLHPNSVRRHIRQGFLRPENLSSVVLYVDDEKTKAVEQIRRSVKSHPPSDSST